MHAFHAIQGLNSGLDLVGFGSFCTKALNKAFGLFDVLLLIFVGILLQLHPQLFLFLVKRIIAGIGSQGLVSHLHRSIDAIVQESLVVGNYNYCTFVIF